MENPDQQRALKALAKRDVIYFTGAFVWTFRPWHKPTEWPFVPWDFQVDAIRELYHSGWTGYDLMIEKSRDMGATWMFVIVLMHMWLFYDGIAMQMVSRKQDLVDKADNPDALFSKADYLFKRLPGWMKPQTQNVRKDRTLLHFYNRTTESVIDGEATTANIGVGGRRKIIAIDEFPLMDSAAEVVARTADNAPCRWFVGTANGRGTTQYKMRQEGTIKLLTLHWSKHPEKNIGLYTSKDGAVEILDKDYEFPPDYPFVLDTDPHRIGTPLRSVWYDDECRRRGSRHDVAEQLDIDYLMSGNPYFEIDVLERMRKEHVTPPWQEGELTWRLSKNQDHVELIGWRRNHEHRRLKIWMQLDARGNPPNTHNYVVGVDISYGQGVSNSVLSALDVNTHRKVAEFAWPYIKPDELAQYAVALCQWLKGQGGTAFLIWESNGPGGAFGKEVYRLGYRHFHWRRDELVPHAKRTKKPGFFSTRETKRLILEALRKAYAKQEFINPSEGAVNEAEDYIFMPDGNLGPASTSEDSSGAREANGDRVIADALCLRGAQEQWPGDPKKVAPPRNSFAWRRRQRELEKRRKSEWAESSDVSA